MIRPVFVICSLAACLAVSQSRAAPDRLDENDRPMASPNVAAPPAPTPVAGRPAAQTKARAPLVFTARRGRCANPRTGRPMKCLPRLMTPERLDPKK